jgi:uridine phosphorylase
VIDNCLFAGQGRLDGAFCDYTEKEKLEFLHKVHDNNILNMEMESLAFAALTHHAGIRAAVICVTLLNRLNGDQVGLHLFYKPCPAHTFSF